jgi:hypothetical protein
MTSQENFVGYLQHLLVRQLKHFTMSSSLRTRRAVCIAVGRCRVAIVMTESNSSEIEISDFEI